MRIYIWLALLAVAISGVITAYMTVDKSSDETQIRSMVRNTLSSIDKRDLGGTIACVSRNYKDPSDTRYDRLRMLIAQALRVETDYTADAKINSLSINGDKATMNVHFTVIRIKDGIPMYERNLTVCLTNENARHAWIIPVRVWRVTAVDGLALESEIKL
jgi:hypothetical protein